MTDSPKLTLNIKNTYGKFRIYPADAFTQSLLRLRNIRTKEDTIEESPCFGVHNIPDLKAIAEALGAELVENLMFVGDKTKEKWDRERMMFMKEEQK